MAYRELGMIEIREIVRRWVAGEKVRSIARGSGIDRKTVSRYVEAARGIGMSRGAPSGLSDDQVEAIRVQVQRPPVREPSWEVQTLLPYAEQIKEWLTQDELRLTKVYRRLKEQGVRVSYSTLYRYAREQKYVGQPRVTVRVACPPPGQAAEIDFGVLGHWTDPATAECCRISGLLVTLCYSRYAYLHVCRRQNLDAVLEGLEAAWVFFGGVTARVVMDNLKPVVNKADRYSPVIDRVFLEYAQYRDFVVDPAVARHATGKPKVERGIPYFRDLTEMQERAERWCREQAGARVHGTTQQVPREVFEGEEQATLIALAPKPFDRPYWAKATVHPDHHIQFQRALYSVPTRYLGQRVEVRGDSQLVRIYHRGELIKTHPVTRPGRPATDYADYPEGRAPYALRAPESCIQRAQKLGSAIGQFVSVLLSGPFPWSHLRQAQKLLRLVERYGAERVNAACRRALAYELLDVYRVENILKAAQDNDDLLQPPPSCLSKPLPELSARFARPPQVFAHRRLHQPLDEADVYRPGQRPTP
jgi:transposase